MKLKIREYLLHYKDHSVLEEHKIKAKNKKLQQQWNKYYKRAINKGCKKVIKTLQVHLLV